MSLKRYSYSVDGTIPVPALLYDDEVLLSSQEGVGIYDGPQKAPHHQAGTVHITTHRLFYVDNAHPFSRSFAIDLSHVARTEYYAGLFTSSSKVTLYFNPLPPPVKSSAATETHDYASPQPRTSAVEFWECEVCSNRNPIGLTSSGSLVCALCGVPRSSMKAPIEIPSRSSKSTPTPHSVSTSVPSSSSHLAKLAQSAASSPAPASPATDSETAEIACSACTFLNNPLLTNCEICGTPLPRQPARSQPPRPPAKSAPTSRPATPAPDDDDDFEDTPDKRMIRLSFRKGGDKNFYNVLKRSLLGKVWESKAAPAVAAESSGSGPSSRPLGRSGINGILRSVETTANASQSNMEDALADLEALMIKWKDMVKLAQDLNDRLTAASTPAGPSVLPGIQSRSSTPGPVSGPALTTQAVEPEEATFIRSSLAQLGLQMANAPVTQDMVRDERNWYEELARELAGVLEGTGAKAGGEGMMRRRGIVGLDEIWGGWNRARGVALIPPATFLQVLPHLPSYTHPPIRMRTFAASGLSVLHTPPYGSAAFAARLVGLLSLAGPRTTIEVAQEEDLPPGLTQEMVDEVEAAGEICRDEGGSGVAMFGSAPAAKDAGAVGAGWAASGAGGEVRWWPNVFRGYVWDGQE
ncbi:EAP30/Vps36 family-domain-containing protein [Trametes polyzona]|nr:EAP30/Vps36 family-domain-containing protein [Trametes polyzona]